MKISTKGRYSLRLMTDLASNRGAGYVALKDISARQNISIKYLEQLVGPLSKAGFLDSIRGPQGGYKLSKNPSEYTIGDILRVTEGDFNLTECVFEDGGSCPMADQCPSSKFWRGLYNLVNDYADKFTLEDLINGDI